MCYSARIEADYRKYVREYGAEITIREFVELFYRWAKPKTKHYIPRGVVMSFRDEPEIAPLIAEHDAWQQTSSSRNSSRSASAWSRPSASFR